MGATTMALPDTVGGDGATLVDLTLVAEEIGRSLAPVPWIDHICAARLLARLGAAETDVVNGKQLVALDPQHDSVHGIRLIPTGSIADQIIVRDGERRGASDLRHPADEGRQHRPAADGLGRSGCRRHQRRAGKRVRRVSGIPTRTG